MKKECIAMLLAGGEGKRLGVLTKNNAKPAVYFGGKYRIIDFALSNCTNSGIDTVGILTQYQPADLHRYVGIGCNWGLNRNFGGATVLPPYVEQSGGRWYSGTANAIFQNIFYIEQYEPEYVMILSGDHIYTMDYSLMLNSHKESNAEVTIAVTEVPWEEASRFGTVVTNKNNLITAFEEKPKLPKSNLASMGIYIFNWKVLKKYLKIDEQNYMSSHDFGKDVIPSILNDGRKMNVYRFDGYWKDVGTIQSLWKANMDLLEEQPKINLYDPNWKIYSVNPNLPPQYIAPTAEIKWSVINDGSTIFGEVYKSVIFYGVSVGVNSCIKNSVIMPNVKIGSNVIINNAIIGGGSIIDDGCRINCNGENSEIVVIGEKENVTNDLLNQKEVAATIF